MNYCQLLLILTASAVVLGMEARVAQAQAWNNSQVMSKQFQQLSFVKGDRNLTSSKGTLKEGSVISIDPDQVTGIPKAEARRRFILNKIYRVQEGTTADDLFIVDEKANKWAVENVSDATEGATTLSVAMLVSGKGRVWALNQQF